MWYPCFLTPLGSMNFLQAVEFIFVAPYAGIAGALGMSAFMYAVSKKMLHTPINMVEAVGSLITGSMDQAKRVGLIVHLASGIYFSFVYTALFMGMHTNGFPVTFFAGLGLGFFHGLIVAYGLMFYTAERHPVAEFRHVTFQVGVLHLFGHVLYGGIVGFLVGLAPYLTSKA
jgi:hypothetical protein